MSKALLDEKPLLVMPQLACKVGLNESIILQQIHYWLIDKKDKNENFYDDRYWVFNSIQEWQKQFPFWSIKTLNRIFTNLVEKKLLLKANYNKEKYDRTLWYSIDYEKLENIDKPERENAFSQSDQMELDKLTKPFSQSDQMELDKLTKPIPEITTETTPKITTENFPFAEPQLIDYFRKWIREPTKDDLTFINYWLNKVSPTILAECINQAILEGNKDIEYISNILIKKYVDNKKGGE